MKEGRKRRDLSAPVQATIMADSAAPTALVAGPSDEHKLSDEDKRTFPLEDGMTNCGGRGLMAGLLGMWR